MTPSKAPESRQKLDHDSNRQPTMKQGLSRILEEGNFEDGQVSRLEVNFTNSGEATYRYWMVDSDDPEGGVLPSL